MAKMISHGSLGMRTITFVWLAIIVVSSYTIIEGRHISREDYLEAKRLVKLSRRPSVKIIQDKNGDIIDCVIIHKQLAFEHPDLKNHTIQMKPTFVPEWKKNEGSNSTNLYIGLKDGGCPIGSVPVRRLQISDILRSTSVSSFGMKDNALERHYAAVHSVGEFLGARAAMNIWNPNVGRDHFSLSQLWIVNEPPFGLMETIETGWMVYPAKFHDHQTRLFTFWTRDGYGSTGSYNIERAGFMQISQFLVGSELRPTSTYDGPQSYVDISVWKDRNSGNWLLYKDEDYIGYWPNRIFRRLSAGASTRVTWGGEVAIKYPNQPLPQMGSGHFPDINNIDGKSCSISRMQVYYGGTRWEDNDDFVTYETTPNYYRVIDGGNTYERDRNIAFGGPNG